MCPYQEQWLAKWRVLQGYKAKYGSNECLHVNPQRVVQGMEDFDLAKWSAMRWSRMVPARSWRSGCWMCRITSACSYAESAGSYVLQTQIRESTVATIAKIVRISRRSAFHTPWNCWFKSWWRCQSLLVLSYNRVLSLQIIPFLFGIPKMFRREDDLKPYKDFNKVIKEFFRALQSMFPHVPDAKKPIMYYKILKTFNKRQPQKRFHQVVGPYTMQVMQRDESFFLTSFSDAAVEDVLDTARQVWQTMTPEQKELVWGYLLQLMQLSYICEQHKIDARKRLFW